MIDVLSRFFECFQIVPTDTEELLRTLETLLSGIANALHRLKEVETVFLDFWTSALY